MCNAKTIVGFMIVLACLLATLGMSQETGYLLPFNARFEQDNARLVVGENSITLTVISRRQHDSIWVHITSLGQFNCITDTAWFLNVEKGDSIEYTIPIVLPANDTVGIDADFSIDGKHYLGTGIYFVTTGDKVELFQSKPKPPPPPPPHYGVPDSLHPRHTRKLSPQYDTLTSKITGIVTDDERRRILESKPMINADVQVMRFNGEDWMRRRGEYKFVPWDGKTTEELHAETIEQQRIANEKEVEVVFDLRRSEDYEYVKGLVSELTAMDEPGCYRAVVKQRLARIIKSRGIGVALYPDLPGTIKPKESNDTIIKPKSPSGSRIDSESFRQSMGWELIYRESFEGNWQPSWRASDHNVAGGFDFWDTIPSGYSWSHVSDGLYSVWCSMSGQRPVTDKYDFDMDALFSVGCLMEGYEYAAVEYDYWYIIESDIYGLYDFCRAYYSFDGYYWTPFSDLYVGDSYGWCLDDYYEINLYGRDTVYFGFRFYSDDVDNYEGVFIDDFRVYGYNDLKPDIVPAWPTGWSGPIVPASQDSTNQVGDLWADKYTFIDFGAANIGQTKAGPLSVDLYLDDSLLWRVDITDTIKVGRYEAAVDQLTTISYGFHTLKLIVDSENEIDELDETNNEYYETFYWDSMSIYIDGRVEFRDLGNNGALMPARDVIVELWDHNYGYTDVRLLPDTEIRTAENGDFSFGWIKNYDTKYFNDELDPYVKVSALNEGARVRARQSDTLAYSFYEPYYSNATGFLNIAVLANDDQSGRMYIADKILDGYRAWDALPFANTLRVEVILNDSATNYWKGMNTIFIDTSDNWDKRRPDTFDEDVILHEYGHKLAHDFDHLTIGGGYDHGWFSKISKELAAQEAFGHFWSCFVRQSNIFSNKWRNYSELTTANLEDGTHFLNQILDGSANDSGSMCEGAVAGMMWDIYDNVADDQDADGVGDYIDNNVYNLLEVLTQYHPRNSDDLFSSWLDNFYGKNPELWAVWFEHGDEDRDTIQPDGFLTINGGDTLTRSFDVALSLEYYDTISGLDHPRAGMQFRNNS
ncbi:MAG: hypothetical protein GY841_08315, partial [FCB group bacterium]|nr:hypothetical protein [FCB group bacterium]